MTEHDDLIDSLRRARPEDLPDEVVSPHAPAAQALLEEILSMQTIDPPETATDVPDVTHVPDAPVRRHRSRTVLTIAGAAAAATAVIAAAAGIVLRPAEPSAAATVDAAIAKSLTSLDVSGRAEVTWREVYVDERGTEKFVQDGVDTWEYSGDDSSVTLTYRINGVDAIPGDVDPINRRVDGELYLYVAAAGRGDEYRWYHDPGGRAAVRDGFRGDPGALLDQLQPAGGFEDVGTEPVDGVETRRLRASHPGETPTHVLRDSWGRLGEVTNLEVWVDDEGLVRRLDLEFTNDELPRPPDTLVTSSATISVRFFDFGGPITIDAPSDAVELSGNGG
jgi:hypothetical protein